MPSSYPALLVAILAGGGWYFTKGPGAGKFGRCFVNAITQAQTGRQPIRPAAGNYPARIHRTPATHRSRTPRRFLPTTANYGNQPATPVAATPPPTPMFGGPAIRIASFNIQVFGDAKASRSRTSWRRWRRSSRTFKSSPFRKSARRTTTSSTTSCAPTSTRTAASYNKVVGPRLGRSNSKEQYAFLYDTAAIEVNPPQHLHGQRPGRPTAPRAARGDVPRPRPAAASKRSRSSSSTCTPIRTKPRPSSTRSARCTRPCAARRGGEDDIILLGDLNVDDKHLGDLGRIDGIRPIVRSVYTNTRQNAQYDNIIFHQPSTTEFSGRWGVYNYASSSQPERRTRPCKSPTTCPSGPSSAPTKAQRPAASRIATRALQTQ